MDIIAEELRILFSVIPACIQAKVSADRVDSFLKEVGGTSSIIQCLKASVKTEILENYDSLNSSSDGTHGARTTFGIAHATFTWSADMVPARFQLRIEGELLFQQGCINAIIGPTASGKSR